MLSDYQLKVADLYNIPIGNVKELLPKFFDKEKYVIHYEDFQHYLRLGLKLKNTSCIRIQSQWLKQCVEFNTQKKTEVERNGDKDRKGLYRLMNNAAYGKNYGKLKKQNQCKTCKQQKKNYLK